MNIALQLGIGLIPGLVAMFFFQIKKRMYCRKSIVLSLAMTAVCGTLLFLGVKDGLENGFIQAELSKKDTITFANALVLEGAYDSAIEIIGDYSDNYGYDDTCRLLLARISLLKEDYDKADALYTYLCKNTKLLDATSPEVLMARDNIDVWQSDLTQIRYLLSQKKNIEDYGYSTAYQNEIEQKIQSYDADKQKEIIHDLIEDENRISDNMQLYANAVAEINGLTAAEGISEESAKEYKRVFAKIEEKMPELLQLGYVSKARIKAYVMAGDFDRISKEIDDQSSYHELMIVAEMYMADFVEQEDFDGRYADYNSFATELLSAHLENIYDRNSDDLSKIEKRKLKARVDALANQLANPELLTLKTHLQEAAEQSVNTDRTKIYLELAKIEHYFENETGTDRYLSEAIYCSTDNTDDDYVYGMTQIIGIIENDEDSELENIKNVAEYVDIVLDNSLTIDVEKFLSPQSRSVYTARETEAKESFAQATVNHVTKARSAISIGKIDTSKFETITARVQISSDTITDINELKSKLTVYDCGVQIKDFELREVEYTGTNIMLVCDVSGSMSGSIEDLRNAVTMFIDDRGVKENLSIVTFSDSIEGTKAFGTSDEEMREFAGQMDATGGTNIFGTIVNCIGDFPNIKNKNNVLIVMTDGQDGWAKSEGEIYSQIGSVAVENGITIYTIGLGSSVDTTYLNTIAASGNGEFLYVSDSASLTSFYDMIHAQVDNKYEITYVAKDTLTNNGRSLEVRLSEDNTKDSKRYGLGVEGDTSTESEISVYEGVSVSGLAPSCLYKGNQDVVVKLFGTGFSKENEINVSLRGNIDYELTPEFVDEQCYQITIPAGVAIGDYDVEIAINGKKKVIENGFSVYIAGREKETEYGPYSFTSYQKVTKDDGSVVLSGMVTMNGWLHFKGDVTIKGDLESGANIRVTDNSGSYVVYDKSTAEGIGQFMAKTGIPFYVPALGTFRLYNDPEHRYDYENYTVDTIRTGFLEIWNFMNFDGPSIKLYPNNVGVYFSEGTVALPSLKKIIKDNKLFEIDYDGSILVTDKNVGAKIEIELDGTDKKYSRKTVFLNTPVNLNGKLGVKLDTIDSKYELDTMVNLKLLKGDSGFGATINWVEDFQVDGIKLKFEPGTPIALNTPVPIELGDFSFAVSQINDTIKNGNIAKLKFTGTTSISSGSLHAYVPMLAEVMEDDIKILEMPDTAASICFSPFSIEANASLEFLGLIKLMEAEVHLGNFEKTNALLGLNKADVVGLSARLKKGAMIETDNDNFKFEMSGEQTTDATTRFVGVDVKGTFDFSFNWWFIDVGEKVTGEAAIGLYKTNSDKLQFVIAWTGTDTKGKVIEEFYYIDENGDFGSRNGKLR